MRSKDFWMPTILAVIVTITAIGIHQDPVSSITILAGGKPTVLQLPFQIPIWLDTITVFTVVWLSFFLIRISRGKKKIPCSVPVISIIIGAFLGFFGLLCPVLAIAISVYVGICFGGFVNNYNFKEEAVDKFWHVAQASAIVVLISCLFFLFNSIFVGVLNVLANAITFLATSIIVFYTLQGIKVVLSWIVD